LRKVQHGDVSKKKLSIITEINFQTNSSSPIPLCLRLLGLVINTNTAAPRVSGKVAVSNIMFTSLTNCMNGKLDHSFSFNSTYYLTHILRSSTFIPDSPSALPIFSLCTAVRISSVSGIPSITFSRHAVLGISKLPLVSLFEYRSSNFDALDSNTSLAGGGGLPVTLLYHLSDMPSASLLSFFSIAASISAPDFSALLFLSRQSAIFLLASICCSFLLP
jgi:hypothetical protein